MIQLNAASEHRERTSWHATGDEGASQFRILNRPHLHTMNRRTWLASFLLIAAVVAVAGLLAGWKHQRRAKDAATARNQPEPVEAITQAIATKRDHRQATTAIGTVLALRSITLRNEFPGTVQTVALEPGAIVEAGQVLVAFDVSVEQAERAALQATAVLAEANLRRRQQLLNTGAEPAADAERALAERDVALAQIERLKATIARKTIRAPFRARVGLSNVHPGQFLETGTLLTTLQGVDSAVHVDFDVAQHVSAELRAGDEVEVSSRAETTHHRARILALDSRVDTNTRNATVRARLEQPSGSLTPGASVRVRIAHGSAREVVVVPASAIRRGPAGDHVFVIENDAQGQPRVRLRRVQSGPATGDEALIFVGLAPGERIAASGSFKLRDEARVALAQDAPTATAATAAATH
jgi:membrane fusion protein (multidrug efflux system)